MKKYKVLRQTELDERLFDLKDLETGEIYKVDFYTNGEFIPPQGVDSTVESWRAWLKSFEGKILELEYISPHTYFSGGRNIICENPDLLTNPS